MSKTLDNKIVTIAITLPVSDAPLNKRPFTLSFGIEGQAPLFAQGLFPEIDEKLRQLWWQFVPRAEDEQAIANNVQTDTNKSDDMTQKPEVEDIEVITEPTLSLF